MSCSTRWWPRRPLPDRQPQRPRAGGGDQQHVHERVPRLRGAAGLRRLRAADGRGGEGDRTRSDGAPAPQLPQDRRADLDGIRAPERDMDRECADGRGRSRRPDAGRRPLRIGRGIACYQQSYGRLTFLHDTSEAWVGVEMDGTVVVRSGVTDSRRRPGVRPRPDRGRDPRRHPRQRGHLQQRHRRHPPCRHHHRDPGPLHDRKRGEAGGGGGSREARRTRRPRARSRGGDIDMAFNEVFVADDPQRSMPFAELVRICGAEGIHRSELAMFRAPFTDFLDPETGQGQAHPTMPTARTRSRSRWTWTPARSRC